MARINGTPRPKTLKAMASYLTRHIGTLIIIAILVLISAGANILGTYLLNRLLTITFYQVIMLDYYKQ